MFWTIFLRKNTVQIILSNIACFTHRYRYEVYFTETNPLFGPPIIHYWVQNEKLHHKSIFNLDCVPNSLAIPIPVKAYLPKDFAISLPTAYAVLALNPHLAKSHDSSTLRFWPMHGSNFNSDKPWFNGQDLPLTNVEILNLARKKTWREMHYACLVRSNMYAYLYIYT